MACRQSRDVRFNEDRIHEIDSDSDRDVAFYREHGYELPWLMAEQAAEPEALARLDAEERHGRVIEGADCRARGEAREADALLAQMTSPPRALPIGASGLLSSVGSAAPGPAVSAIP